MRATELYHSASHPSLVYGVVAAQAGGRRWQVGTITNGARRESGGGHTRGRAGGSISLAHANGAPVPPALLLVDVE